MNSTTAVRESTVELEGGCAYVVHADGTRRVANTDICREFAQREADRTGHAHAVEPAGPSHLHVFGYWNVRPLEIGESVEALRLMYVFVALPQAA